VPRLGRRWDDLPVEDAGECRYHQVHPDGGPGLAAVGDDHFVACFKLHEGRAV
jgi:hypothetical protein